MNKFYKNIVFVVLISAVALTLYSLMADPINSDLSKITYDKFYSFVAEGKVKKIKIDGNHITGSLQGDDRFETYSINDPDLIRLLKEQGVQIEVEPTDNESMWVTFLVNWFPMLLLIGVWIFFLRQMQGSGNKAMSFGKSKARVHSADKKDVTFDDVAGLDEPKVELREIIAFLKDPQKFQRLGGKIPKGVLLYGPPGTGKTLLARAVAGEADVPFYSISGSDFVEMFVGVGASRVRDLFEKSKKNAPCIIFMDEIDAVGRQRFSGVGGGHDEREQTLNQLLVEMDGFEANEGVIMIAATNRPDVLDPALMRPGRFDRQIVVDRPDVRGREEIIKVHSKHIPLADNVDCSILARRTPGFSGADLANMTNEAALLAAREDKNRVEMVEFESAIERVMVGPERKSRIISPRELQVIACHEAGHALVNVAIESRAPVHKVTIIPRGIGALGLTWSLPSDDLLQTAGSLLDDIAISLGGMVAEDIVFGQITNGCTNDLKQATKIAQQMVKEFGMSEKLGPIVYGHGSNSQVFLGRDMNQEKEYSEETSVIIDMEVRRIVEGCYQRARKAISTNRRGLYELLITLLSKEVLVGDEVVAIISKYKGQTDTVELPVPVRKTKTVAEPEAEPGNA